MANHERFLRTTACCCHTPLATAAPSEQRRDRALFTPLPVRLGSRRFRDPDVIDLRPERLKELHGQPDGADLVVEIVSEGKEDRDRDLITKRPDSSGQRCAFDP